MVYFSFWKHSKNSNKKVELIIKYLINDKLFSSPWENLNKNFEKKILVVSLNLFITFLLFK